MAQAQKTETTEQDKQPDESVAFKAIREKEELGVAEYIESLGAETPIQVVVRRKKPKVWKGVAIEGTLDTFEEPIDEEDVKEQFGGGHYELIIKSQDSRGSYVIRKRRTIKIAGPPKLEQYQLDQVEETRQDREDPSIATHALGMAQRMAASAEQARMRAEHERMQAVSRTDPATEMAMQQISEMRRESAQKDQRLLEMMSQRDSASKPLEMILGKMVDGESSRIQALQMRHESELRMKDEGHKQEMDRMYARFESIAKTQEDSHKRELDNLVRTYENQIAMLKMSYDAQIKVLEGQCQFVSQQLGAAQTEAAALRVKKERSPLETISELAQLQEAMTTLKGGDSSESSGGTLDRLIGAVSPVLEGVASRVAGMAPPQAPQPQAQAQPQQPGSPETWPLDTPIALGDGRVMMRRSDGSIVQLQRRQDAAPQPTGEDAGIKDEDIRRLIPFLENALAAEREAVVFANSARSMTDTTAVRKLLGAQGADGLLARIEALKPDSPILTQHGKNWAREVAKHLMS